MVIIDEASQSGPEAIILNYIAKKVVVVGDDKQIRPSNIGIDHDEAEHFRKQYLSGIEHSESFGLTSSYFSQAELRFPNYIRLKEHFRCMPEIIRFSNNLCYQNAPLIPLRQYPPDRLDPVRTVFVGDGFTSGFQSNRLNKPEAEKLVEVVCQCCEDRRYDNKSMGVISLLGGAQSKYIQGLLIDRLGPEEIEKRGLVCGNAYNFQGDERDVIFLSLVISTSSDQGPQRPRALTRSADKQRFNVAASRAKDQLWLFPSVTLNHLQ
ncbi:MAG: DNA helicase, partial [candidate division Zixibacteria bacterium]|nr:DNA helicase [candidate division Zixibacteria bacterium]